MTNRLSHSDVGIRPVNEKNLVVSLPPTLLPSMDDVEVEDVLTESASGSGVDLRSAGRNEYKHLQIAM